MNTYQNQFFKFEINFSEGWRVRSWSMWKNPPQSVERYQTSDNDLPCLENKSKQLFYARETVKEKPSLFNKQLYMDVVWKEKDINIGDEMVKRDNEILRLISTENIMGREWQSLIRTFDVEEYNLYHQLYVCNVLPNIWLYASAVGDSKDNFKSSKKQFLEITQLK